MKYNNFLSLRIKNEDLATLKKAIWLYNQENNYNLTISEERVHSSCKGILFIDVHFYSEIYHTGYETNYITFDLGKYFQDALILY